MESLIRGEFVKYIIAQNGYWGQKPGSISQITHDGDTVKVFAAGNISLRFLGVDTPEISFNIEKGKEFVRTDHPEWEKYFADIGNRWPSMEKDLGSGLHSRIMEKLKKGQVGVNHYLHAKKAEEKLEELIRNDAEAATAAGKSFAFFIALAYEFFDSYGRMLAFVHEDNKTEKKPSYNQQLLSHGAAFPYFIWPNINPYRRESSIVNAVYDTPGTFRMKTDGDKSLREARDAVVMARKDHLGIFGKDNPVILEPFELRYLGRKEKPSRYYIHLGLDDDIIYPPDTYTAVQAEDRLFIPDQYLPLFREKGWKIQ